MELGKSYTVNVISQTAVGRAAFLAVEMFSLGCTPYFGMYFKNLKTYSGCGDWYDKLDFPDIDVGNVIIVQTDVRRNLWARAIVTRETSPKYYLIDYQKFCPDDKVSALKPCPLKFLQLILPTYNIDTGLCLNSDDNRKVQMLIYKNQMSQIYFKFTPQSIQNNVYFGTLSINNTCNNKSFPIKELLKSPYINNFLYGNDEARKKNEKNMLYIFDPLNFKHLKSIFAPRILDNIDLDDIDIYSSSVELNDLVLNDLYSSINWEQWTNLNDTACVTKTSDIEEFAKNKKQNSFASIKKPLTNYDASQNTCYTRNQCTVLSSSPVHNITKKMEDSLNTIDKLEAIISYSSTESNINKKREDALNTTDDTPEAIISSSSEPNITKKSEDTHCKQNNFSVESRKFEFIKQPLKVLQKDQLDTGCQKLFTKQLISCDVETAPPITVNKTNVTYNLTDENDIWWSEDES